MNGIRRVVCGISGGVDSAVSAYLLKQKGFSVTGVFMTNWDTKDEGVECSVDRDREDAAEICRHLGIPFREVNFVKEYWNEVFERMVSYYERGMTPNPDVLCNRFVKFDAFSKYAHERLGADAIATGHYARTTLGPFLERRDLVDECRLLRAVDQVKDQTFWLSQVRLEALKRVMFPLGNLLKPQVKAIARDIGLQKVADRKESMGICFIGKRNFRSFIDQYVPKNDGVFRHCETFEVLGRHDGIHHFTLGQRSKLQGSSVPYFVSRIQPDTQEIELAPTTNHPALFSRCLATGPVHWLGAPPAELKTHGFAVCEFRWQNRFRPITCELVAAKDGLVVYLQEPMRALSPGQYAVFYRGDVCLGSAVIVGSRSLYQEGHYDYVPYSVQDQLMNYEDLDKEPISSRC